MGSGGSVVANIELVIVHTNLTSLVIFTQRNNGRTVKNRLFGSYPSRASNFALKPIWFQDFQLPNSCVWYVLAPLGNRWLRYAQKLCQLYL
jgi:hypothetical protein